MKFTLPSFRNLLHERTKDGDNWYYVDGEDGWDTGGRNLAVAQNHPILTPALLFVAKLFSQADFKVRNKNTKAIVDSHWLLDLLENPNKYQSRMDFLESLEFMMIAQGSLVVYAEKIPGFKEADNLLILRNDLIEYPSGFNKATRYDKKWKNVEIRYDKEGDNLKIKMKDLLYFYDLPNLMQNNKFKSRSRLDGLSQTLKNTKDSLKAKNIILKTNGKELITGKKGGFPFGDKEQKSAQRLLNSNFGLGKGRSRSWVTKADVTWKSLHIALRDLGLDESVKVDGNLIYTALHIPKDILSLEAKKTTYNNYKESMVSYIQNEMQSTVDAVCLTLSTLLEKDLELVGSYEHLPVMQFIMLERFDVIKKQADSLGALLKVGVPEELALEMSGFPKGTKLENIEPDENETAQTETDKQKGVKKLNIG